MLPIRDAFAIPLRCMHCKTWGTAHLQEHRDDQGRTTPGVTVPWVSTGFRVSREGKSFVDTEFRCSTCDEVAG